MDTETCAKRLQQLDADLSFLTDFEEELTSTGLVPVWGLVQEDIVCLAKWITANEDKILRAGDRHGLGASAQQLVDWAHTCLDD